MAAEQEGDLDLDLKEGLLCSCFYFNISFICCSKLDVMVYKNA